MNKNTTTTAITIGALVPKLNVTIKGKTAKKKAIRSLARALHETAKRSTYIR